jgi:hypothetical protein
MSAPSSLFSFVLAHPYASVFRAYALALKFSFVCMFVVPLANAWYSVGYESFLHVAEYSGFFFVATFVAIVSEIPWFRPARTTIDALYALVGSAMCGEVLYVLIRMGMEKGGIG